MRPASTFSVMGRRGSGWPVTEVTLKGPAELFLKSRTVGSERNFYCSSQGLSSQCHKLLLSVTAPRVRGGTRSCEGDGIPRPTAERLRSLTGAGRASCGPQSRTRRRTPARGPSAPCARRHGRAPPWSVHSRGKCGCGKQAPAAGRPWLGAIRQPENKDAALGGGQLPVSCDVLVKRGPQYRLHGGES